jgi:hypothetical protein
MNSLQYFKRQSQPMVLFFFWAYSFHAIMVAESQILSPLPQKM